MRANCACIHRILTNAVYVPDGGLAAECDATATFAPPTPHPCGGTAIAGVPSVAPHTLRHLQMMHNIVREACAQVSGCKVMYALHHASMGLSPVPRIAACEACRRWRHPMTVSLRPVALAVSWISSRSAERSSADVRGSFCAPPPSSSSLESSAFLRISMHFNETAWST